MTKIEYLQDWSVWKPWHEMNLFEITNTYVLTVINEGLHNLKM